MLYSVLLQKCLVFSFLSYIVTEQEFTFLQVLDLSFNDFKGPGFEPLENCKALQVHVSPIKGINDVIL